MPELPEVESFRAYFEKHALNRKIIAVHAPASRVLQVSPSTIRRALDGEKFVRAIRRGKVVLTEVSNGRWLVFHFGMTGHFVDYQTAEDKPAHIKLEVELSNGHHFAFDNMRTFGQVDVADSAEGYFREKKLGPDALEMDLANLREQLGKRSANIKTTLLNQSVVSGIGNLYSDEVLFQTRIHPERKVSDLSDDEVKEIHRAISRVLKRVMQFRSKGDPPPEDFLLAHRSRGGECPGCGGEIARKTIGGRTCFFCPECQK